MGSKYTLEKNSKISQKSKKFKVGDIFVSLF